MAMKITEVSAVVVSVPGTVRRLEIVPVLDPVRMRFTHRDVGTASGDTETYLIVRTDEGIEGVCTGAPPPGVLDVLRTQVIGSDPLRREELYQRLHLGTRWVYQTPGWFGNFDNCLWDIAGKVASLPVCRLLGQVRDRIPAYLTGGDGDGTTPTYRRLIERARETWGIEAFKFHNYQGARQNIAVFTELRRVLGDEYVLINDPVCSYSLEDAITVGHAMEELGFLWLEEPFFEQDLSRYQRLCDALTRMPVMATEMLMYDTRLCAEWLIARATDLIRVNARNGTSALIKLAHFAELHGTNIEMNAGGGLGGHVHVQLQCALMNTYAFEYFEAHPARARAMGITNVPEVCNGHLEPSMLPGWGAVIDWEFVRRNTVATY